MVEAEGIPPTASVVVPGLSLNYAGEWAYAYSGAIVINNNTKTQLLFTTGSGIINGLYEWGFDASDMASAKVVGYIIKMNDIIIYEMIIETVTTQSGMDMDKPVRLIIPPFTKVEVQAYTTRAIDMDSFGIFTGRVYNV